jgi:xylulokinase
MNYILGIDIGTQGIKGVLLNEELEIVEKEYIQHNVSGMVQTGWVEHCAEGLWWNGFKCITKRLINKVPSSKKKIVGIGCSSIGACMVPISAKDIPLRKAILYNDTRDENETKEMIKELNQESIIKISKNSLTAQFVGPKILWFKKNEPIKFKQTNKIFTSSNYIVYKLTKKFVLDYPQAAYFNPFYNYERKAWSKEICNIFGIPYDLFPEIRQPIDIAGKVTKEASRETGLQEGTPVIVSTFDALTEIISMGVFNEGVVGLLYSTASAMLTTIKRLPVVKKLFILPHPLLPKQNLIIGTTATSAALTEWFRNNFAYIEREIQNRLGINAYELLSKEATYIAPGSDGLLVLPYFLGERTPINDPLARGVIIGLTTHHSRTHIYRALLEGTAYAFKHNFDLLKTHGIEVSEIIASGGGTKSRLWTQIVSNVIGKEQILPITPTGAEIGVAYLVAVALGIANLQNIKKKIKVGAHKIVANKNDFMLYQKYYNIYRGLYQKVKKDMHILANISSTKF